MSRLCPNGHEVKDNLRFCPICGAELQEKTMKFCKKCGNERKGTEKFCSKCGTPFEGIPTPSTQNTNHIVQASSSSTNLKIILPIIIGVIILALVGGGWFVYNKYIDTTAAKNAKEQAVGDSIQQEDNKREDNYTDLWLNVWGNIGDSSMAELQFEKGAGWYVMSQDAPVDSRRILKVKSYDKKSGRLVFNAYYKGEYIGILDGIFQSDKVEVEPGFYNVIQSYSGKFKSVKGVDIVFSFHGD